MFAHSSLIFLLQHGRRCRAWAVMADLGGIISPPWKHSRWINKPLMMPPWITEMLRAALLKCKIFFRGCRVRSTQLGSPLNPDRSLQDCYQIARPHYWQNPSPSSFPIRAQRGKCGDSCSPWQRGWWFKRDEMKQRKERPKVERSHSSLTTHTGTFQWMKVLLMP